MPRYPWVVLDADGTLFDYEQAELNALTRTFGAYGLRFDRSIHRIFADINSRHWRDFENGAVTSERLRVRRFEELATVLEMEVDPAVLSTHYLCNLGAERALLPGAQRAVERLAESCNLVLATNGFADVQNRRIAGSTLRPYFDAIVISDEIGVAKPERAFFEEVFARMGHPDPDEVIMVGDSLSSDIAGGHGYGIDTCWFNPAERPNDSSIEPTYEIGRLEEVVDIATR